MSGRALDGVVAICCAIFVAILLISGAIERDVLILHLFQSLIYVAIVVLCIRKSIWGYAVGISISIIWDAYNSISGFVFHAGFRQWALFARTGHFTNFVQLLAPIAWFDHVALAGALAWAYARRPNKRWTDALVLAAGFVVTFAYFFGIIAAFWPQFIPRARQLLHL